MGKRGVRVPEIRYPAELPVSQRKDDILRAIRDHQVVVIAGETGSGKTTQIPKICLELGRGIRGRIGHTQPRRLAARTVAERIADELGAPPGTTVGYKTRFTDQVRDETLVKLMTDGILLAEIHGDRLLRAYDTLIIDEAHERSLNIDFILGYLRELLPRRPDLKVIITSATIDPERFARHFGEDVPVIEVSGRTYPVEVRYRPLAADAADPSRDQVQAICDAIDELAAEGPGDILVFLSGEREIRDTAEAVRKSAPAIEVLPLYARLSSAEQRRVFQAHDRRRVVLATNVAETSLTVPGIKYVIDPGTARISRYSHRTKVQRLPIEPVSQASANQRKGRCGRTSDGICIRLYAEEDFLGRPEFTDPEILRTSLASVILQMAAVDLGEIERFPFLDPPDRRDIKAGVQLLEELGAFRIAAKDRLTATGRKIAQLPVDPRLARMVLAAGEHGCLHEVLVITAALSIQDPRERPADSEQAADDKHRRFTDGESDFLSYLNLWNYIETQQKSLSGNQFRRLCKRDFLHYLRVREWQDLYTQLRRAAKSAGLVLPRGDAEELTADRRQRIHFCLLAGLLSHVGMLDSEPRIKGQRRRPLPEYRGARGARFAIFPGSALAKARKPSGEKSGPPGWLMAAELVETSRLWARTAARIDPAWAEELGQHLLKRNYSEPHWSKKQGAAMAYETVTLYGIPLAERRRIHYARIDPELSRELFIRHALVYGEWQTHHGFLRKNQELITEIEDLEARSRRHDIIAGEEDLFTFYDERIPADVVSSRHFDRWWKKTRPSDPDLLDFDVSLLVDDGSDGKAIAEAVKDGYPDAWRDGTLTYPLSYVFEPGAGNDGVTARIPLQTLNQVTENAFAWQVPGLREELVTAYIKSLPKALRRNFAPAPDFARAVLGRLPAAPDPADPLTIVLGRELRALTGVSVSPDDWDTSKIPAHLRINYLIVDEQGNTLGEGRDLAVLKRELRAEVQERLSGAADELERAGLRDWTFGDLPRVVERERGGFPVKAYPALSDEKDSAAVRVFGSEPEQRRSMWRGTRRLLLLNLPPPHQLLRSLLTYDVKLALSHSPHGSVAAVLDDCAACAVNTLLAESGGPVWNRDDFAALRETVRPRFPELLEDIAVEVSRVLDAAQTVARQLPDDAGPALGPSVADLRTQLDRLVFPGFVAGTGRQRLPDLLRYLNAMAQRLGKLAENPGRDRERMSEIHQVQQAFQQHRPRMSPVDATRVRWMIEELRVSYFAQSLGTPYPVSRKRLDRTIDELSRA